MVAKDLALFENRQIAALARDVFELADRDPACQEIIDEAAAQMAHLIVKATRGMDTHWDHQLAWVCSGGVAINHSHWLDTIRSRCQEQKVYLQSPFLVTDPVDGAIKLAAEKLRIRLK
jgi:N-acetylglucosamine kinase-like BadF-type ATPase